MKILPVFLPIFAFTLPAALVLYFVVSNTWRIGQQAWITRTLYSGEHALGRQAQAAGRAAVDTTATEVIEEAPPSSTKVAKASTSTEPKTSAMGRNRRADNGTAAPRRASRPPAKKKPSEAPATKTSSRVTPPGQPPRPPKKKRSS
jgi:membrane protein insertase Oxa1/YidC/SpoIIIJ